MNTELKRRAFLLTVVGALLGAPVAVHLLRGGKGKIAHSFTHELNRLQALTRVPIQAMEAPSSTTLTLRPEIGTNWNYTLYAPAFLPKELSHALADEPDMFLVREGQWHIQSTNKNQTLLSGGDTNFSLCSPLQTEERLKSGFTLLLENQQFHPARPKHQAVTDSDRQFVHLLSLPDLPKKLVVGKKWKSGAGRVKPFIGYSTDYEIVGFAEVATHKTVQVRFAASIPNLAQLPGVNASKPDKDASMMNTHQGNAWFDLSTGMLVRQEVEMTSVCKSKEIVMKDKSNALTIKSHSILQLTTA